MADETISRRTMVKRAAVASGGLWAVPTVTSRRALGTIGSPEPPTTTTTSTTTTTTTTTTVPPGPRPTPGRHRGEIAAPPKPGQRGIAVTGFDPRKLTVVGMTLVFLGGILTRLRERLAPSHD